MSETKADETKPSETKPKKRVARASKRGGMISTEQIKEMISLLKSIEEKLDTLVNFQRTLMPKPKIGKEEGKVLKLCDRKNTIAEMATKTGKTSTNVNFILSQLRSKGIIRSVRIKDRTVYEKI